MSKIDFYIKALKVNSEKTEDYYQKFLANKSEQQKFLEKLLIQLNVDPKVIADIACGSGTLTYHINKIYPSANYILVDLNDDAINLAKENIKNENAQFLCESIYNLSSIDTASCDLVFCWQTLSWIENPEKALKELIRICKPNGKIFASSLFNKNYDVDIYSKVLDKTSKSSDEELFVNYNTYSEKTIRLWVSNNFQKLIIHPFETSIDFEYNGRGLGTNTIKLDTGKRIQVSGGMLLNWGILQIDI